MTATATWRELFDRLAIALQADALARHRRKLQRKPSWMLQHLRALKDPPAEMVTGANTSMWNYTTVVTPKRAPRQPSSHVGRLFAPVPGNYATMVHRNVEKIKLDRAELDRLAREDPAANCPVHLRYLVHYAPDGTDLLAHLTRGIP